MTNSIFFHPPPVLTQRAAAKCGDLLGSAEKPQKKLYCMLDTSPARWRIKSGANEIETSMRYRNAVWISPQMGSYPDLLNHLLCGEALLLPVIPSHHVEATS
jgi:hypothetical protein